MGTISSKEILVTNTLTICLFITNSIAVAIVHIFTLLCGKWRTFFATAEKLSICDQVLHIWFWSVDHAGRHHMPSLWRYDQSEISSLSKITTNLFYTISIHILVQRTSLTVERIIILKLNLLCPFLSLNNAILHIKHSNIDQYFDTLRKKFRK